MASSMFSLVLLAVTGGMSHAETAPEFVKMSDLKQLITEATVPLLARIETLETKVMALEAGDLELKSRLRQQESLANQYQVSILNMEKEAASRNQRCLSLARRLKFLEKAINSGRPAKASKQLESPLTKESPEWKSLETQDRTRNLTFSPVKTPSITKRAGSIKRGAIEAPVAFQVVMGTTRSQFAPNQDVAFDTVITNVGNAFRATHGLFMAPVPGIYVFSMTIMSAPGHNTHAGIAVNGNIMVAANAKHDPHNDQVSNSLVVQLDKGDDVAVRILDQDASLVSIYGGKYSSFSGFLLTQDVPSVSPIGR